MSVHIMLKTVFVDTAVDRGAGRAEEFTFIVDKSFLRNNLAVLCYCVLVNDVERFHQSILDEGGCREW